MSSQVARRRALEPAVAVALVVGLWSGAAAGAGLPGDGDLDALLSSDVSVVMGLKLGPFVESPLYAWLKAELPAGDRQKLDALKDDVGVDLERDVDSLLGVVSAPGGEREVFLASASGRFDPYRAGRALEQAASVSWKSFGGTTLYLLEESSHEPAALAFRGERSLLFGRRSDVERVLGGAPEGEETKPADPALLSALGDVPVGADFWWVGDERFLGKLPWSSKQAGESGFRLPPLRSMILSGELGSALGVELVLEAGEAGTARKLGDALRGLVALGSLQAARPELQRVLGALRVSADGPRVKLEAKLEYAWLEALKKKPVETPKPAEAEPQ
jgi:hypothetical protein